MTFRFVIYVALICGVQFAFFVLNASGWTYPVSTFLFLMLLSIEGFYFGKQGSADTVYATRINDPSMDLDTAKRVQEALLAIDPPETDKVKIVRRCVPASTLGGDFYTFVNKTVKKMTEQSKKPGIVEFLGDQENLIGITIGDVAGHGVSSALVMALSSGLLGRIGLNNRSPAVILQRANVDIQKFISTSMISHVTAFYGALNLEDLTLTFANAGHPAGIVVRKDQSVEFLSSDGIFLGMYPDEVYNEKVFQLVHGDRVLLFTDGIVETINEAREAFGMQRLIDMALLYHGEDSDRFVELVFEQLFEFRQGSEQKDDQTLIVVDVK